ncbi:MAG: PRC-barrel domain-containing protein [Roseovarius sp.]|uniref:PRC-barrel domain-containing protein n=1 Tax=Roseovarius sp. TaxID=1486281 RepID=UPI0032EBA4EE
MKRFLMTTAIAALAASPVLAASETAEDTSSQVTESTDMSQTSDSATSGNDVVADMQGMQISASELIGKSVYILGADASDAEIAEEASEPSDDWERVGEIGDVIISGDGNIESVTLDAGGFLGINEKHISASMDELKFVSDSSGDAEADEERNYFVVFTGDKTALEDRDQLDQAAVRDAGSSFFNERAEDTASADMEEPASENTADAGNTDLSEQAANNEAAEAEDTDMAESDSTDMTAEQDSEQMADTDAAETEETDLTSEQMAENDANADMGDETAQLSTDERGQLTAEELEGVSVYGTEDDRLGEISDLVLSEDGKISEVIVDVGGFLGIGEKPVALPFDDLELRRSDDEGMTGGLRATTGYTSEELEGMESWEG